MTTMTTAQGATPSVPRPGAVAAPGPAPTPGPPPLLPSLHGMRFIAALVIFSFHGAIEFVFADQKVGGIAIWLTSGATGGVAFFFMLSGFVLTWVYRPGEAAARFWRRRFVRVLPNHLVTFVLAILLLVVVGEGVAFPQTLTNLFLVQAWFPDNSYLETANGVSWSLSVDLLYYLSFPLLIVAVTKIKPGRLWLWLGVVVALVIAMPLVSLTQLPNSPTWAWGEGASWTQIWFVYLFPPVRMLEMVVGMLLARIIMTQRWIGLRLLPATLIMAVAYVATLVGPWSFLFNYAAVTVIPSVLLIGAAATTDLAGRRTWVNSRKLVFLGDITFAFYLVHDLVLRGAHLLFGTQAGPYGGVTGPQWSTPIGVLFLAGVLVVSIGLAWVLYSFVELPAMRRWSRPRRTKAPAAELAVPEPAPVQDVVQEAVRGDRPNP